MTAATPRQQATRRSSAIQREFALMTERLTGKAAPVHDEKYRRVLRVVLMFFIPVLKAMEQEKGN